MRIYVHGVFNTWKYDTKPPFLDDAPESFQCLLALQLLDEQLVRETTEENKQRFCPFDGPTNKAKMSCPLIDCCMCVN